MREYKKFNELNDAVDCLEFLGEGQYGKAFKAKYEGRVVCCKKGKSRNDLDVFLKEAAILVNLDGKGGSPRLVAYSTDYPCIVMEYCEGSTLLKLARESDVTLYDWFTIFRRLIEALREIHEAGFVHCDIKPDNVIVNHSGSKTKVHVIDFGMGSLVGEYVEYDENGDGGYMSPDCDVELLGWTIQAILHALNSRGVVVQRLSDVVRMCLQSLEEDKPTMDDWYQFLVDTIRFC